MRDVYIPDLTERFPEGFDGIDLTDSYFPCERGYDNYDLESAMWDSMQSDDEYEDF